MGMEYTLVKISDRPELAGRAARWFAEKWGIPLSEYETSIAEAVKGDAPVPQWYLALAGEAIIGGMGVIENDFHARKDLAPNVCDVYTEPGFRRQGVAGALLRFVCGDMAGKGIGTLYLLTDHTGFYERYGWEFYGMVQGDGEAAPSRMYRHIEK